MAVTAKFLADFSDFSKAVKDAEVQLKGMETGAGKVTTSLNKMVDSLSGRKLVQDATLAAEAVERIGGVSKLTAGELQRLGSQADDAIAKLKAIGKDVPDGIQKIATAAKNAEDAMAKAAKPGIWSDLTTQVKATALGFISAQAVISGVSTAYHALTAFIGSSVDAYAEAEAAQRKLTAALTAQGFATPTVIKQYDDLATQFQKTTAYSDDLVNEMQALLVQVGNVMPSKMNAALKASTDLASGLGIDLRSATLLVAKAFSGGGDELGRLKAILGDAYVAGQGMEGILAAINQKFGGQAQAEIETYAGKIKQLKNEWNNFQEAVGAGIVLNPSFELALKRITEEVQHLQSAGKGGGPSGLASLVNITLGQDAAAIVDWLDQYSAGILKADKAAKAAVDAIKFPQAVRDAWSLNPIPTSVIVDSAKLAVAAYVPLTDAQKAAADAALAHAKAIQTLADAYSGTTAIKAASDALEAVNKNLRAGKTVAMMTRDEQNKLNDVVGAAIKVYQSAGRVVPLELRKIYDETHHLRMEMEQLSLLKIDPLSGTLAGKKPGMLPTNLNGQPDIPLIPRSSLIDFPTEIPGLDKMIIQTKEEAAETEKLALAAGRAKERFEAYAGGLRDVSDAFGVLAQMGGRTGQIFSGAQGIVQNLKAANDANKAFNGSAGIASAMFSSSATNSQKWASGVASGTQIASGAMSVWAATADDGTKKAAAFHGAMAGAQAGAAFGPYGMAIGAVAGAVIGMVHAMSAGRREVKAFAESFNTAAEGSGFDELRAKLLVLGAEGERLWIKLTQQTKKGDKSGAQAVEAEIKRALALANDPTALNQMIRNAQVAGVKIPAALKPVIENLIRTGQLTQENANLMLGLPEKGVPSFEAVSAAAERLGIKLDELGPKVQGIKFTEEANQMALDFQTVQDAGADMGVVFDQAAPKVQKLIENAKKYGIELPLALKPFLQDMVDAGKLTDENGKKLEDLSGIKFAEPLSASVDRLIGKLDELIETLAKGVGGTLDAIGRKVVRPTVKPQYDPSDLPDNQGGGSGGGSNGEGPGFAGGTHGKYLDFGAGRRVTLHGKERVMTEAEGKAGPGSLLPFPSGGGSTTQTIVVNLDGRQIAEVVVPQIPDVVKRYGLA